MSAQKKCPSCGKQWPADAPYCGHCATSLHNVSAQAAHPDASAVVPHHPRIDDEYITMFRTPPVPDGIAAAHVQRVDDGLLWAHVQRLTVVVWIRYIMALVCGIAGMYALSVIARLPDSSDWSSWHVVCAGAVLAGIYLATGAIITQAQRDMLVMQLRPRLPQN